MREDGVTLWALGRLGARLPLYGPLNCVVPAVQGRQPGCDTCWRWQLAPAREGGVFAGPAGPPHRRSRPRSGRRAARARSPRFIRQAGADRAATLVEEVVALESREEHIALGDTLPPGLRLVGEDSDDRAR